MFFVLHLDLEGITETDTDPEGKFVSFKATTSNKSSLFVPLQGISGLKKFGARSFCAPNVHQTSIGGTRNIVHQHYFSWESIYSTPSSRLYGDKQN